MLLAWLASATGYRLEQQLDATQPQGWSLVVLPVAVLNGRSTVIVAASETSSSYRLSKSW